MLGLMYKTLSPFYPHGGIPIPFSGSVTSQSVEGIWQGLKVGLGGPTSYIHYAFSRHRR